MFRRLLSRTIKGPGSVQDGKYIQGVDTTEEFYASIQPLTPAEIEQLPEGRRNRKPLWLFTSTRLNEVTGSNPDVVTIDSEKYEVDKVHPWQNGVISHYKCLVMGMQIQ